MPVPLIIGGVLAGMSLLSSLNSANMAGQAGKAAYGQSVYSAGLNMRAGEVDAAKNIRLAENYFLDAFRSEEKKKIAMSEKRREHKIIKGKNRGAQQGLESDGTSRTMAVEDQEAIMQQVEDVLEWDWDNNIARLESAGREANYAAEVSYANGINNANATLYSGGQTAAAYTNQANTTTMMAIPKAVASGVSAYSGAGGVFGAQTLGQTSGQLASAANTSGYLSSGPNAGL